MPANVIHRLARFARRRVFGAVTRAQDLGRATYGGTPELAGLGRYLPSIPLDPLRCREREIRRLAEHWLEHRFDLLGSGWVQVRHAMRCRGVEGHRYASGPGVCPDHHGHWLQGRINAANLDESARIWRLVDEGYVPIDWQLDFKSGYRWSEHTWYRDIRFGHRPGADIKAPWELGRMQHLPQLAWAYALATADPGASRPAAVYAREFRNQVLDFIATNPPRFGANWHCTMEVAIRAANWLAAYDLLRAWGAEFDGPFAAVFVRSIYEHGRHIVGHLEHYGAVRGNHYLANIAGLLFVAAYLPSAPLSDAWLSFAIQELVAEVEFQFRADGSNFEHSTSYHRLSAEMVVYATALILALLPERPEALEGYDHRLMKSRPALRPAPLPLYRLREGGPATPFPSWYVQRLAKMAEFTADIAKPGGQAPQIGDNDSGRFFKFQPVYRVLKVAAARARFANLEDYRDLPDDADYYEEDHLDHRHLVAASAGLFEEGAFPEAPREDCLDTLLVRALRGSLSLPSYRRAGAPAASHQVRVGTTADWAHWSRVLEAWPGHQRESWQIEVLGDDLLRGLEQCAYVDFGLYLYRSRRLYLAIRCGGTGGDRTGAHAHQDQLAVELNVDGEDWISDPGTYLYTPLPQRRNQYRSASAHRTPARFLPEAGRLDGALFRLESQAKAACLGFTPEGFLGVVEDGSTHVYRRVALRGDGLSIEDYWETAMPAAAARPNPLAGIGGIRLSPGYGQIFSDCAGICRQGGPGNG